MPDTNNIEQYSEEARDILGEIPGSLIRWGLTIIFLIFFSIVVGSFFFKFRDVVSVPMVITTTNPPAPLICKASGRIFRWFASDGQQVKKGDYIAVIENSASFDDIIRLEKILSKFDTVNFQANPNQAVLPEKLILGDLQNQYNQFYTNWENFCDYRKNGFLKEKIRLLQQEMAKQTQYYKLSSEQKEMYRKELNLAEKTLKRHRYLLDKGGIAEAEMEQAEANFLQSKKSYSTFIASLKSTEINLIGQKRSLVEMLQQKHNNEETYKLDIADNIRSLRSLLRSWEDKYLVTSPIAGVVTLTKFWSINHVVSAGERLATVIPTDKSQVICRAKVPSSGIGKVHIGQRVNLKLSGFPYMQFGILRGTVNSISLVPEGNDYIVEIRVNRGMQSSYREHLKLVQEMTGTAEIITRERRLLFYFLKPLKYMFSENQ